MKNRIAELRTTEGWSQAQLAERLAVSRQTVNALESSKNDPGLSLALRISWLFKLPVESIFVADLDEKMLTMSEKWEYLDKMATAFDEVGILEKMGVDGWEMTGFGAMVLRFRRPENPQLRRPWEYQRLSGLLLGDERSRMERDGWLYCGSWMSVFHYFKRESPGFLSGPGCE